MVLALSLTISSLFLFILYERLTAYEKKRGRRFFAGYLRGKLDWLIVTISLKVGRAYIYVSRYILTLTWYYGLHKLLMGCLRFVASFYYLIEGILLRNRDRAKKIRSEKKNGGSHLSQVAEHKTQTALTETEKKKLKKRTLDGR